MMTTAIKTVQLRNKVNNMQANGEWENGVKKYANLLLDELVQRSDLDNALACSESLEKALLSGAMDWEQYSAGGLALAYDDDIADMLGAAVSNQPDWIQVDWIHVQAQALQEAADLILNIYQRKGFTNEI